MVNATGGLVNVGGAPSPPARGLATAIKLSRMMPDPPGLHEIGGRTGAALRELTKVVYFMCYGRPGFPFFAGSISFAMALGCSHVSVQRRLRRLEALGVVRRTWTGGLCRRDPDGHLHPDGALLKRASEYLFLGLAPVPT